MKIAKKISLSFLLTAVIITTVALFIIYLTVSNNLKKSVLDHLTTAAKSRANHITILLKEHKHFVQLLSSDILLIEILNMSKDNPEYNKKRERVNRRLNAMVKAKNEIIEVSFLDKNGIVVASTDEAFIGSEESADRTFFKKKEPIYIRDLYISENFGMPVYEISTPILLNVEF